MARKKRKGPSVVEQQWAEQIRSAIRASGLSLHKLGDLCDVATPQLSRFVLGERTLTLPAVARVCHALGLRLVGPERPARPAEPAPSERPKRPGRPRKKPRA
jgi:hypothetical protein